MLDCTGTTSTDPTARFRAVDSSTAAEFPAASLSSGVRG